MKNIQWVFLIYAVVITICLAGIGIAIALQSTIGVITCISLATIITGSGMKRKQKFRNNGQL